MTIDIDSTVDTAIVGAGPAGLSIAKRLVDRGVDVLVLDDHERVGDPWRERYRSLRLFTPRPLAELPGAKLPIGYFSYPTGSQIADYLEHYVTRFALPVRTATRVVAVTRTPDLRFRLSVDTGHDVSASRVIVAAGAHRIPVRPPFAEDLATGIRSLHSLGYRGPEQLADGPVLVVGAANSGTDIALEAAHAGHAVTIAGRHPGQVPGDIDNPLGNLVAKVFIRRLSRRTIDTDEGRALCAAARGHGVNLVRNTLRDLHRAGIRRIGRITGVDAAGQPVTADGTVVDAATVVWCTGSRPDFSWLRIDGALDASGWPAQYRGISGTVPGLAFLGLPFQYSPLSPTLFGIQRDADYLVARMYSATPTAVPVTAASVS